MNGIMVRGCHRPTTLIKKGGNIVNVNVAAGPRIGGSIGLRIHKTIIL